MSREVVLFQTHDLSGPTRETFERLRADAPDGMDTVLLFETGGGGMPPADLRGDAWTYEGARLAAEVGRRRLRGGYTNLPAVAFHRAHPGYRRYWLVEYDMRFSGPWSLLFGHFAEAPEDLIAVRVRRYASDPTWFWWDRTVQTLGEVELEDRVAAFLPICRYTEEALRAVAERYARGWRAHAEVLVPTALDRAGLSLRDFGGTGEWVAPGDRNRFYISAAEQEPDGEHPDPTMRWMPAFTSAGPLENKLYHPVKPEQPRFERLRRLVARQGR